MSHQPTDPEIRRWLVDRVAEYCDLDPAEVDTDRPWDELGLLSRDAVALSGNLEEFLGRSLSPTLAWQHPTIARLAHALATPGSVAPAEPPAPTVPSPTAGESSDAPIAVIGLGCRLPGGVEGPRQFWEFLLDGGDGISAVSPQRWEQFTDGSAESEAILERTTRWGGFLDDVAAFDAEHFNISPREAETMDPQQRMLLEVAVEALQHAGVAPERIRGTNGGVFVGVCSNDYGYLTTAGLAKIHAWTGTGAATSVTAGRLSYLLDLRGPSLAVDTACSSSLVAIHLACASLRSGETGIALAAGANLLLSPAVTVNFDRAGAMAGDGHCKTFDADADGYVRAEGCGVVVLKRLPDALRDGDRVLAVIRGSAVHSDGHSNGLMAPNPEAQEGLLRSACALAGVDPLDVDYVEAHGTGTLLGDPIEANALGRVLASGRSAEQPLLLGSVKTNVGHLEAAAGVAGVIKTVLSLWHRKIPANLHYREPNPRIAFDDLPMQVVTETSPWPTAERPARAGVSSFGFNGTIAHVVLEEAPASPGEQQDIPAEPAIGHYLLSTHSTERLPAAAESLADWLSGAGAETPLADVGATLARRGGGPARAVVVARSRSELVDGLRSVATGEEGPGVVVGEAMAAKPVWVFSGQGSQWAGMGRQLLAAEPAFAEAVAELEPLFLAEAGFSLREVVESGQEATGIDRVQPVLFGLQVALARLWQSYGVMPAGVIGHSMGEVAAAVVAGALSAEDGVTVIARRSRLLRSIAGGGAMAVLELPAEEATRLAADFPGVELAVHSSPNQAVVAGDTEQVERLVVLVGQQERLARLVKVDVASHSPQVDPLLADLATQLAEVRGTAPEIRFYSTVEEDTAAVPSLDNAYWVNNLRRPVRLAQAVATAAADGHVVFTEVSPHPVLIYAVKETLAAEGIERAVVTPTLRRDTDETAIFHAQLATLHAAGHPLAVNRIFPGGHVTDLPTTPWQRSRYWVQPTRTRRPSGSHPLLGSGSPMPGTDAHVWRADVGTELLPWLADHRVDEMVVLPAAAYVEIALAAATQAYEVPVSRVRLTDVELHQVLPLAGSTPIVTRLTGTGTVRGEQTAVVEVHTQGPKGDWVRHASTRLAITEEQAEPAPPAPVPHPNGNAEPVEPDDLYARLRAAGQQHGAAFQTVTGIKRLPEGTVVGTLQLPEAAATGAYGVHAHPVLLDGALQLLGVAFAAQSPAEAGEGGTAEADEIVLPKGFGAVHVYGDLRRAVSAAAVLRPTEEEPDRLTGSVRLADDTGDVLLEIADVQIVRLTSNPARRELDSWLFEPTFEPTPLPETPTAEGSWLVIDEERPAGEEIDPVLATLGASGHATGVLADNDDAVASAVAQAVRCGTPPTAVVVLCPPRARDAQLAEDRALTTAEHRVLRIARVAQAILRTGVRDLPRLYVVTRGAQAVQPDETITLAQSALRGVVRVLTYEHSELRPTLIDLDPDPGQAEANAAALVAELTTAAEDDEIAIRGGTRLSARLVPAPVDQRAGHTGTPRRVDVAETAVELVAQRPGVLDTLRLAVRDHVAPEPGQVTARVHAAGLNFSDVLKAHGIYPSHPDAGPPRLGGEFAGVVTAIGDGVTTVAVGDRVLGFAPGSLGSFATTSVELVARIPDGLETAAAATLPIAYGTAWYALRHLARLQPGERVLIHAATGGVGLAALAIARLVGAEVYATAGSEAKRAHLRDAGVEHVYDSRSLDFADEILVDTGGAGIDVVLNTLSGEALRRSIALVAPGGRLVELGKKDTYGDTQIGLGLLAQGVTFATVDLDLLLRLRPAVGALLLSEVLAEVTAGRLTPVPHQEFPLTDAEDAFRLMARAGHIGKIVLTVPEHGRVPAVAEPAPAVRPDGGYILVGGLGGLGQVVADWLAEQGAGLVVLNGRSEPDAANRGRIEALRAKGMRVEVVTGDIARPGTARRLVAAVEDAGYRLRGVVHGAAVLDDETALRMTPRAVRRVFAPKVAGGWWLHQACLDRDLDFFVVFSSAASLIGSPGQTAYAAANAWLDGLVAHRRAAGLPALGVNWGPWGEVGAATHMAGRGFQVISPELGVRALEALIASGRTRAGVLPLDARRWFQMFPAVAGSSFFVRLSDAASSDQQSTGTVRAELAAVPPGPERVARVESYLSKEIRLVLRLGSAEIDREAPIASLGFDSLMALELRNRLEVGLGARLPATLAWSYPTIAALAAELVTRLGLGAEEPAEPDGGGGARDEPEQLSGTDADVLAQLLDTAEELWSGTPHDAEERQPAHRAAGGGSR
ncbi:phthiocerol/phenolphthiocerol synthesis polyketide synthase type I PpsC [Longimycelium tulufanense]|uniref:Phthiocerol/phenolphthiocerol synthesis polyketide synthase type I PpsC n=1 Tax=Longimycelium tulufanense TaxID=907463 RepID=A0A8J3CCG7_9PSEU|nr:type I polyketide synthase [Longimycelium tulufanense]GGM45994.1 phthiocerol/phenolphthiocerol synthesis polyketide synthase type I PpsC [Longimycelium tulufanense]